MSTLVRHTLAYRRRPVARRFLVFNRTDGILAHPEFMSFDQARDFIKRFRARFTQQGYYLTAAQERIPAECVELTIMDAQPYPMARRNRPIWRRSPGDRASSPSCEEARRIRRWAQR